MVSNHNLKVLCLHGHPGNSDAMQIFVQHFRNQGITAIAPDLRGYGNCKANSSFTMLDHIHDLWKLITVYPHPIASPTHHQDLSSPSPSCEYLVLGWSLGGILAIELALHQLNQLNQQESSPKIIGLILIATAANPRSNIPRIAWWEYLNLAISLSLHSLLRPILINPPYPHPIVQWFGKHSLLKYLIQQHHLNAYDQITKVGIKAYLQTSKQAHQALQQSLKQGYNRTSDLAKIQIPCLIICANQDRHITPAATTETARLLPCSQLIIYPNTAHLLPWEIPNQILADIDQWCDRHF